MELLITMVILGILAGIAVQNMDARKAAYLAMLKSDLRNLVYSQEVYFIEHGQYAPTYPLLDYTKSPQVIVNMVSGPSGYTIRVMHQTLTNYRCAIFVGDIQPIFPPAVEEGKMACEPKGHGGGGGGGGSPGNGGGNGKGNAP